MRCAALKPLLPIPTQSKRDRLFHGARVPRLDKVEFEQQQRSLFDARLEWTRPLDGYLPDELKPA